MIEKIEETVMVTVDTHTHECARAHTHTPIIEAHCDAAQDIPFHLTMYSGVRPLRNSRYSTVKKLTHLSTKASKASTCKVHSNVSKLGTNWLDKNGRTLYVGFY